MARPLHGSNELVKWRSHLHKEKENLSVLSQYFRAKCAPANNSLFSDFNFG